MVAIWDNFGASLKTGASMPAITGLGLKRTFCAGDSTDDTSTDRGKACNGSTTKVWAIALGPVNNWTGIDCGISKLTVRGRLNKYCGIVFGTWKSVADKDEPIVDGIPALLWITWISGNVVPIGTCDPTTDSIRCWIGIFVFRPSLPQLMALTNNTTEIHSVN